MTQQRLATLVGVDRSMISKYIHNVCEPSFDILESISVQLNVDIDFL